MNAWKADSRRGHRNTGRGCWGKEAVDRAFSGGKVQATSESVLLEKDNNLSIILIECTRAMKFGELVTLDLGQISCGGSQRIIDL